MSLTRFFSEPADTKFKKKEKEKLLMLKNLRYSLYTGTSVWMALNSRRGSHITEETVIDGDKMTLVGVLDRMTLTEQQLMLNSVREIKAV